MSSILRGNDNLDSSNLATDRVGNNNVDNAVDAFDINVFIIG